MIIGEVAEGLDVLKKLGALYLDGNGRPWEDVPHTAHARPGEPLCCRGMPAVA